MRIPVIPVAVMVLLIGGAAGLFFLLSGLVKLFRFLQYGLALVLGLIGVKMIVEEAAHTLEFHLPEIVETPFTSLVVISVIFTTAIVLSKMFPGDAAAEHGHGISGGSGGELDAENESGPDAEHGEDQSSSKKVTDT